MPQIGPFIHFNGNAEEAFNFYRSVFGGAFSTLVRFSDLPDAEQLFAAKEAVKIMRISLPIGNNSVLMGSDVPEILGQVNENENRSKISLIADSKEEADRIFNGLSSGGSVEVPLEDGPMGSYFGMFRDRFGIEWMIEYVENP